MVHTRGVTHDSYGNGPETGTFTGPNSPETISFAAAFRLKNAAGRMTVREGGEYDNCDDERTIYFLQPLDEAGRVAVSMRARPTDDKRILSDVFRS